MRITVKFGDPLWRASGSHRVILEWPDDAVVTVADVLARLSLSYPAFAPAFSAAPYRIFVDAVTVDMTRHAHGPTLQDAQTLFILLPAIGGAGTCETA